MTDKEQKQVIAEYMRALGKKGGAARAKNTSKERLSEIGKYAASKRWPKAR